MMMRRLQLMPMRRIIGGSNNILICSFSSIRRDEEWYLKAMKAAKERSQRHEVSELVSRNKALIPQAIAWKAVFRALLGNTVITAFKFGVFLQSGSSAMLSEAVHTLADCGNQILLLKGLQQSSQTPDRRFQYGYGKASFFWALVSALGMFWTGAGVSVGHGIYTLIHPPEAVFENSNQMLAILGLSFLLDGWVLSKTFKEVNASKPSNISIWKHLIQIRDPFVLAVLYEDLAACCGVLLAGTGIYLTQLHHLTYYDTIAGISVGVLIGAVAVQLISINRKFLLGQAVDDEIITDIREMLKNRPAIMEVHKIQSQWIGPSAFAFKAECDFNGYFFAKKLEDSYIPQFQNAVNKKNVPELKVVMAWMAEDVTRLIEREVKDAEEKIRQKHPMAAFIELEPDSGKSFLNASDEKAWPEFISRSNSNMKSMDELIKDFEEQQPYQFHEDPQNNDGKK